MRKFGLLVLVLSLGFALDLYYEPLGIDTEMPVQPVRALILEPSDEETSAYSFNFDNAYAPGQTVTFNIVREREDINITAVSAVILGETVPLREYTGGTWSGTYTLPAWMPEGVMPVKIYLRGPNFAADETVDLNISYPIRTVALLNLSAELLNDADKELAISEAILLKPGDFYSELHAEVNRQRLMSLGFFERVEVKRETQDCQSDITFTFMENPTVRRIVVTGNRALSEKEIITVTELQVGQILANRQLQKDIVAIEKLYRDQEYLFAKITSFERPTTANGGTLTYRISEGEIGDIRIIGNDRTKTHVITREMDIKPGDVFNASMLREDLRNIYNLNYFQTLIPDLSFNEDTGKIDLDVKVEEKRTSQANLGGGYGEFQGWFGFVDFLFDNLWGSGQSVLLKASWGQKLDSYQIRYHNPWMWDNKTSFTGRLWSTYGFNYLSGQREIRNGWSTAVGFRRNKRVMETYSFRYEDVRNLENRAQNYEDRAVGYGISYDSRDQWMNPTMGQYASFTMDHSAKLLGGSINASRYGAEHNYFHPLAEKQVLAFRSIYNYQLGDILPSEQYYLGSDSTVRGYPSIFAKGNERVLFNVEYRYIFADMFVGVLFYDIGQATQPVFDPLDKERGFTNHRGWGAAQGFGIRIITPMGPLRLDYGWPQNKEFADGFLSFNMGNTF